MFRKLGWLMYFLCCLFTKCDYFSKGAKIHQSKQKISSEFCMFRMVFVLIYGLRFMRYLGTFHQAI